MSFRDVVEGPDHAALQDRKEPFRRVRVSVATNVFFFAVVDGFEARELATDVAVLASVVGHQG